MRRSEANLLVNLLLVVGSCCLVQSQFAGLQNAINDRDNGGSSGGAKLTCDPSSCARCLPNGRCQACQIGYVVDSATNSCKAKPTNECHAHCASTCASGPGLCDGECDPGFVLGDNKHCYACDSNCDLSSGCKVQKQLKCDEKCIDGFTLTTDFTCQPCSSHCLGGCDKEGKLKCDTTCELGFALNADKMCLPCDANCEPTVGCPTPFSCNGKCKFGYALTKSSTGNIYTCQGCHPHCAGSCQTAFQCDSQCKPGYTICNTTKSCQPCSSNCDPTVGCANAGPHHCDQCLPNQYLDPQRKACYPCAMYCDPAVGCSAPGECNKCLDGFDLIDSKCHLNKNPVMMVIPDDDEEDEDDSDEL